MCLLDTSRGPVADWYSDHSISWYELVYIAVRDNYTVKYSILGTWELGAWPAYWAKLNINSLFSLAQCSLPRVSIDTVRRAHAVVPGIDKPIDAYF